MSKVINYFSPRIDTFWKWSQDGNFIEWPSGKTLGVWSELSLHLNLFGKNWPPLGALVLCLYANKSDHFEEYHTYLSIEGSKESELIPQLKKINELFKECSPGTPQEINRFINLVFEEGPHCTLTHHEQAEAKMFLDETQAPISLATLDESESGQLISLEIDAILKANLEKDSFLNRYHKGYSSKPEEIDLGDFDLLEGLRLSPNRNSFLKWVDHMYSLIKQPPQKQHHDEPEGVEGLNNRGAIHRLNLSEWANDPLVLANRILQMEALYQEPAVHHHQKQQQNHIFIDTGLAMWGATKIFSLAVGMALHKQWDGLLWYFLEHGVFKNHPYKTLDDFESSLKILSHHFKPWSALLNSLESIEDNDTVWLVTHKQCCELSDINGLIDLDFTCMVVIINEDGEWEILSPSKSGYISQQKGKLLMSDFLNEEDWLDTRVLGDLPAFYSDRPMKLLMYDERPATSMYKASKYLLVFKKGCLYWYKKKKTLPVLITNELFSDPILCSIYRDDLGVFRVVMLEESGRKNITVYTFRDKELYKHSLSLPYTPIYLECTERNIYVNYGYSISLIKYKDGAEVCSIDTPENYTYQAGRDYFEGHNPKKLYDDGLKLFFESEKDRDYQREETDDPSLIEKQGWKINKKSVFRNILSIAFSPRGHLFIRTQRSTFILEEKEDQLFRWVNYQTKHNLDWVRCRDIEDEDSPISKEYEWNDGSKAYLDPRGLLHFVSTSLHIPDVSITLYGDSVAIASSDGRLIGNQVHFGEKSQAVFSLSKWSQNFSRTAQ